MPTDDLRRIAEAIDSAFAKYDTADRLKQAELEADKVVDITALAGVMAIFKVVGLTLEEALKAGLTTEMAERMAYDMFVQTLKGASR